MNAQEAIELVEKERDDLSELVYKIESNWSESRLRSTREEIEALSIVLESARMLHEVLEAPTTEVIEEGIIKCFVNGSITIDKKTQKDIGIAEGVIK